MSTNALFLLKYNYGLLWLVPLLVHEWWLLPRERRDAWRSRAAAWLRAGGLLRPGPLFVTLYLLALAAILVTGGGEFTAFSRRVSVRPPGNPADALLVLLTAWAAVAIARRPVRWRGRWRSLSARQRVLLATVGAPLLAWLLIPWPNRVRAPTDFLVNRASGPSPWSLEGLLYDPRACPWGAGSFGLPAIRLRGRGSSLRNPRIRSLAREARGRYVRLEREFSAVVPSSHECRPEGSQHGHAQQ